MSDAPASLLVPALIRQVNAAGGFATILHKGHEGGHALVLVHLPVQGEPGAYERVPSLGSGVASGTQWRLAARGGEAVDRFCERQKRFDPDLWILELMVAAPERFIAGWPTDG